MNQNIYTISDVLEFECVQGPDGVWYPKTYAIIGQRKKINGHEVEDDGTPKRKEHSSTTDRSAR